MRVKDYDKQDGTHVKSYTREQSSSPGASGELPPENEDEYVVEATVTGDLNSKGDFENTKVSEIKMKPKEGDQGDQDKVRARDRRENDHRGD